MGMLDFFKSPPTKEVTVGAGGLRDAYLSYLEQASIQGIQPMTIEQFVKALQEQKQMQQQQMPQFRGLMQGR